MSSSTKTKAPQPTFLQKLTGSGPAAATRPRDGNSEVVRHSNQLSVDQERRRERTSPIVIHIHLGSDSEQETDRDRDRERHHSRREGSRDPQPRSSSRDNRDGHHQHESERDRTQKAKDDNKRRTNAASAERPATEARPRARFEDPKSQRPAQRPTSSPGAPNSRGSDRTRDNDRSPGGLLPLVRSGRDRSPSQGNDWPSQSTALVRADKSSSRDERVAHHGDRRSLDERRLTFTEKEQIRTLHEDFRGRETFTVERRVEQISVKRDAGGAQVHQRTERREIVTTTRSVDGRSRNDEKIGSTVK
ncbi:hypothetical protein FA15DRAFT_673632 [Coprinopsis marcescibilis]|uniref:Uncharacterized protein n=1 Tax=Coprinopsis marcescibilis TaxID=230819 RepID=A0A5C3KJB2_COPMA|nr:hypothetical protein FA15DRAFT_673632 [Coprinopsis marcescibilis]